MFKHFVLSAVLLFAAACCVAAPAKKGRTVFTAKLGSKYRMVAKTNRPDARAKIGDEVKIAVKVESKEPGFASAQLFVNGLTRGKARIVEFGKEETFVVKAEKPGTVSVICSILDANRKPARNVRRRDSLGGLGVLISPEKIVPGNPKCPDDFDEFWAGKRAELDKVPVKELERKEVKGNAKYPGVACYDVKVDCSGDAKVSGYLCMPRNAKPKSLPAIVIYHGSGVKSSTKQFRYGSVAIAFDVNAHGIPNGKPKKFYAELDKGVLKGYTRRNLGDRDTCYFIGVLTRVMRALDYVKSLPEWDGRTLIVTGPSQGGGQALAAAGLDPQVTFCSAGVPALCDLGGRAADRRPGWPAIGIPFERQTDPRFIGGTAYIDGVFFARRIKCPIVLSAGFIDNVCHAASVYSAYNSLPKGTKKSIRNVPTGHHWGTTPYNPGAAEIDRMLGLKKK